MAMEQQAKVFKALGNEVRLMLLDQLSQREMCACMLQEVVDISQSTISHHMNILCDSGIVEARRDGKWTFYSISQEGCGKAIEHIQGYERGNMHRKESSSSIA